MRPFNYLWNNLTLRCNYIVNKNLTSQLRKDTPVLFRPSTTRRPPWSPALCANIYILQSPFAPKTWAICNYSYLTNVVLVKIISQHGKRKILVAFSSDFFLALSSKWKEKVDRRWREGVMKGERGNGSKKLGCFRKRVYFVHIFFLSLSW